MESPFNDDADMFDNTNGSESRVPSGMKLPNGRYITFNSDQVSALENMLDWFYTIDEHVFTLEGFAGTGKTTIVKCFLNIIGNYRVIVSAPTHKAKNVIARSTGLQSYTIQSILGLQPNTDLEKFDINNPKFILKGDAKIAGFRLAIIDEGSMMNTDLAQFSKDKAIQFGCKLLLMGDSAQLPPVNEKISRIFSEDYADRISLLEIVERQSEDNPVMEVYDRIRGDIRSPKDRFLHETRLNDDQTEGIIFTNNVQEFKTEIISKCREMLYQSDPDYCKVLCWTNDAVKQYNRYIRKEIYGDESDSCLIKGEFLMAYTTIGYGNNVTLENSADYQVVDIQDVENTPEVPYNYEGKGLDKIVVEMMRVVLKPVDPNMGSNKIVYVVKPNMDNYLNWMIFFNAYHNNALNANNTANRRLNWRKYYDFKNSHLLLTDIKDRNGKLIVKKDLDYCFAITVHKSQGSTYKYVFVDEDNIELNRDSTEKNNLKYVGFSRPTNIVFCLSSKTGIDKDLNSSFGREKMRDLSIHLIDSEGLDMEEDFLDELESIASNYGYTISKEGKKELPFGKISFNKKSN